MMQYKNIIEDNLCSLEHVDKRYYDNDLNFIISTDYVYISGHKRIKCLEEHLRCNCHTCYYKWSEITDDNKEGRTF